jgi:hypothetical protein
MGLTIFTTTRRLTPSAFIAVMICLVLAETVFSGLSLLLPSVYGLFNDLLPGAPCSAKNSNFHHIPST